MLAWAFEIGLAAIITASAAYLVACIVKYTIDIFRAKK